MNWKLINKCDLKENWSRVYRKDDCFIVAVQMNACNYEVGFYKYGKLIHTKYLGDKQTARASVKFLMDY